MSVLKDMSGSHSSKIQKSVLVTDSAFVPFSTKRLSIVISAPQTNRVTLAFGEPAVLDQGITLYPGGPPLVLSRVLNGSMCGDEIRAISAVGTQTLTAWEVGGTDDL